MKLVEDDGTVAYVSKGLRAEWDVFIKEKKENKRLHHRIAELEKRIAELEAAAREREIRS